LALPAMCAALAQRGFDVEESVKRVAAWMASGPARLAGLTERKGALAAGADADFVVFDPDGTWTVREDDLHFRHKLSPYLGAELRGRVLETWLHGECVFAAGEFVGEPRGRELVRQ
jgi:allantoinase